MKRFALAAMALAISLSTAFAGNYKSFKVSVYTRAYEVEKMADPKYLEPHTNKAFKLCR